LTHSSCAVSLLYAQRRLTFAPDAGTSFGSSLGITVFEEEKARLV